MNKRFSISLLLCASVLAQSASSAPAAGLRITNQAQVSLQIPSGPVTNVSNIVSFTVAPVCTVSVTPNGSVQAPAHTLSVLPGEGTGSAFAYQIRNPGSDTFTYVLSAQQPGGTARPTLTLRGDSNGNGQLDSSDQVISSATVAAGASAPVWLVAQTSASDQGNAQVNLVASCAGGQSDTDNVSVLTVSPPPVLEVNKVFGAEILKPGAQTDVTITLRNTGALGRDVTLTDPLAEQASRGLTYVAGSARTTAGTLEYSADGTTWAATEAQAVTGLRVRLPTLAAGAEVRLTFRVQASAAAENQDFVNNATAVAGLVSAQARDSLRVQYRPAVAIGPAGQPEAQGDADRQTRPFALAEQDTCFEHTVKNTGDVQDNFTVSATVPAGVTTTVRGADGAALAQPFALAARATLPVRVCYLPTAALAGAPLKATVTVGAQRGPQDTTLDEVGRIETRLPQLQKSVSKEGDPAWQLGESVTSGDVLTYTLRVTNPYNGPLTGVQVSDPLPAHLDKVTASDGGVVTGAPEAQTVAWNIGILAPGETRTLTIRASVSAKAVDDEQLRNVFQLVSTDFPQPLESNAVSVAVWNTAPAIKKEASPTAVTLGDVVTYTLTLINKSPSAALTRVIVNDAPDSRLQYVPGTSLLDGVAIPDPTAQPDGTLRWNVDRIGVGAQRRLQYGLRVMPGATGDLNNTVVMQGRGASGQARAIASNRAYANIKVQLLNFAPVSDILGRVYLDLNANGVFDEKTDLPMNGARVILAGGRLSLTDARGRYHFGNVLLGTQALRLDPASVPYASAEGSPATRTLHLQGLTTADFALRPNEGSLGRRQSWPVGPATLTKTVTPLPNGEVAVRLSLKSPRLLGEVTLTDTLPAGARLSAGTNTLSGALPAEGLTLEYRYLPASAISSLPLTKPTVAWKE
ncbi:DUF11 domain-containing protein [Deinococcus sp.]|uniref:DUF11 domain-containing protein n=1 Tax=Deinococcus sp. TaxID=47478 RepID=UPI0025C212DA|nr:DUF11 domain-containing protein [Deinococcus sp.]